MSRGQRAVQSSAWRRRVQGLACARQVQSKTGEGLAGLCWQFRCTQLQLLGSARATNSVVVVPTSTDPMGILKSTREFKALGAGKEHTSAMRGGGRDPGVRRPGSSRSADSTLEILSCRNAFLLLLLRLLLNKHPKIKKKNCRSENEHPPRASLYAP